MVCRWQHAEIRARRAFRGRFQESGEADGGMRAFGSGSEARKWIDGAGGTWMRDGRFHRTRFGPRESNSSGSNSYASFHLQRPSIQHPGICVVAITEAVFRSTFDPVAGDDFG